VHGCKGEAQIFVGGLDRELSALLTERFAAAGFRATAEGHRYPGVHALNICNRGARGRGAQIELTRDLREPPARARVADVARAALADYVALLESA
jgi:phage replication-related protein YjqB (UPF0714/DUF867 family)